MNHLYRIAAWLAWPAEVTAVTAARILNWVYRKFTSGRETVLQFFVRNFWPQSITANMLTCVRIFCGLLIVVVVCFQPFAKNPWVVSLLIIALLTELLDGPVARAFSETRSAQDKAFGSFLDKLADRVLYIPLTIIAYWPHDQFWVRLVLILSITGGIFALFWQLINWLREESQEVPENPFSKISAVCYVPVVLIPLFWPDYWYIGFYCAIVAGTLGIQSVLVAMKNFINGT